MTPAEVVYIHSDNEAASDTGEAMGWPVLFRIRRTWAFVVGKFMTDPVWWFFLFWLPSYFSTTFKLDLKKPSWPLVIIYTATTIGSIGGGYLSSFLIRQGWVVTKARSTSMLFFALAVVPIMAARFATDIWQAVALISLAAAAHQAWSATIYTTVSDTFPKRAVSSVIGIGGMAGSIGGILFQWLIGPLLDYYKEAGNLTLGYNVLFTFCGFAYLIAWIIMHFLGRPAKAAQLTSEKEVAL